MTFGDINIRDPFILAENGKYYLYGTRAANFGCFTGGFDVYVSDDLVNWSDPVCCFDSSAFGMNTRENWAPEVHFFGGAYYMFATFRRNCDLRGTFVLRSDSPMGPFVPHSDGAVTPDGWECLDGTLYVEDGTPYLIFCHEHSQIIDGTVCFIRMSGDMRRSEGEPVTLFSGSSPFYADPFEDGKHFVTDGPFMYRTGNGTLLMIWSTFIKGSYAQCLVRFAGGKLSKDLEHLPPLIDDDGGHGMIFTSEGRKYLILHTPNTQGLERPALTEIADLGDTVTLRR